MGKVVGVRFERRGPVVFCDDGGRGEALTRGRRVHVLLGDETRDGVVVIPPHLIVEAPSLTTGATIDAVYDPDDRAATPPAPQPLAFLSDGDAVSQGDLDAALYLASLPPAPAAPRVRREGEGL